MQEVKGSSQYCEPRNVSNFEETSKLQTGSSGSVTSVFNGRDLNSSDEHTPLNFSGIPMESRTEPHRIVTMDERDIKSTNRQQVSFFGQDSKESEYKDVTQGVKANISHPGSVHAGDTIKVLTQEELIQPNDGSSAHEQLLAHIDIDSGDSQESIQESIRARSTINKDTLKLANSTLRADASPLKNDRWWESITKMNPVVALSTVLGVGLVATSMIVDILDEGDSKLFFQRSGAGVVCWAMTIGFVTLAKRSGNLDTYDLKMDEINQTLSRGKNVELIKVFEELEEIRVAGRESNKASLTDWVCFVIGLIGTVIWGYGDFMIS